MRARNIKPGFFQNELLTEVSFAGRLLFIGLWTLADREGRLEDRPRRIKMQLFPVDDIDIDGELDTLARYGFVTRYERDGGRYIQIVNFAKHQRPHTNESQSVIPPSLEDTTSHHGEQHLPPRSEALRSDSLNDDSLNPHSLNAEAERASAPAPAADPLVDAVVDVLVDAAFVNDASDAVRTAVSRAYQLVPDFNRRDGPLEAMQFVAYYTTGKGKRKQPSDWAAAWRNWLKQAVKYERQAEDRHAENGRTAGQRREVDGGAAGSGGEDEYVRQRGYSYDAIVGLGTTR